MERPRGSGGMGGVEEIAAGIWYWERRPRGLAVGDFGGRVSYAIKVDDLVLLVDPLVDGDQDGALDAIDDLVDTQVRILVTMPFHVRSADYLRQRYREANARIYGHPGIAARLKDPSGFVPVRGGGTIEQVARMHAIGHPVRSEQPIEIPKRNALVFGDSVVRTVDGELRVWEDAVNSDRRRRWWHERYLPTLQRLADLEPAHVLVTHGQPVIGDGSRALRGALEHDAWQRPRRRTRTG